MADATVYGCVVVGLYDAGKLDEALRNADCWKIMYELLLSYFKLNFKEGRNFSCFDQGVRSTIFKSRSHPS